MALLTGALLLGVLVACSGPVGVGSGVAEPEPVAVQPEPVIEPEPVIVRLHVSAAGAETDAALGYTRLKSASAGDGTLVPSTTRVEEGESFRLRVRFSGTTPIVGTCTISLVDSSEVEMPDVSASVNGFDASSDLIPVKDDGQVTSDRKVVATLESCDLPDDITYEIGDPNTATVNVTDKSKRSVPPPPPPRRPEDPPPPPPETKRVYVATLSSSGTVEQRRFKGRISDNPFNVTVNWSPALPVREWQPYPTPRHTGQYACVLSTTYLRPDNSKVYRSDWHHGMLGGASSEVRAGITWDYERNDYFPIGTKILVQIDSCGELLQLTGTSVYEFVSWYGYYSIGSPSSVTVTVTALADEMD